MKKILITSTDLMMLQFLLPHVHHLRERGFDVEVACSNVGNRFHEVREAVGENKAYQVRLQRSPAKLSNFKGLSDLRRIIQNGAYDVIWTNEPVMGIMTRIAAKKARKRGTKVMYMAHGFHFYKGAPKKNWLIYYPIEKHFAKRCDTVVTITEEDYRLASKKFKTSVARMHGVGVDAKRHYTVSTSEKLAIRKELQVDDSAFICLCTGELNSNKNQSALIGLVPTLKEKIPNFRLWLAGKGILMEELEEQIRDLGVEENVKLLGYQSQIEKYVRASDIVLSASKREGLPFNVLEAMLAKKPVVLSDIRGHRELVTNLEDGFITNDLSDFAADVITLYEDQQLYARLAEAAFTRAQSYTAQATFLELDTILAQLDETSC